MREFSVVRVIVYRCLRLSLIDLPTICTTSFEAIHFFSLYYNCTLLISFERSAMVVLGRNGGVGKVPRHAAVNGTIFYIHLSI